MIKKSLLRGIKKRIKKVDFLRRSSFVQLVNRWINRIPLLLTIYKDRKTEAIRKYFYNDLEYLKVKKEIGGYRNGSIYNFGGAKLPLSFITADSFFNVLKPASIGVIYRNEDVRMFHEEQKSIYKTLIYLSDNLGKKEPDYAFGHITSHGFTYFLNEVVVNKNDVVIDLGAAPGDFSAVCIKYGASKVYAFEPEEGGGSNLLGVSKLNENKIDIVRKFCGRETIFEKNIISLDDFVSEKNIGKVNFIKADIEGGEVDMLKGASNVLKRYKPKLAICTYHSVNDEKNIEIIIRDSNSEYKIYKQNGVIYAF